MLSRKPWYSGQGFGTPRSKFFPVSYSGQYIGSVNREREFESPRRIVDVAQWQSSALVKHRPAFDSRHRLQVYEKQGSA